MKTIEIVDQTIPYKTRARMRRKSLTFRQRHFTVDEGVVPFFILATKCGRPKSMAATENYYLERLKEMSPTTIYITGDRSLPPIPAVNLVNIIIMEALVKHPDGIKVITGDALSGVERAVRYLVPEGTIGVFIRTYDEEGHMQFDDTHEKLVSQVDKVFVIHTDPLNSRLAKSVAQIFPPEKVEYPLDQIVNQAPSDLSEILDPKLEPIDEEHFPPEKTE